MNEGWRPRARGDVTAVEVDDDLVILDGDGQLHVLNPTAGAVWRHCDGERAVADIVTALAAAYRTAPESVGREVAELMDRLQARGLVS